MEHKKLAWAKHDGKKALEKAMATINCTYYEALLSFLKATYFMEKEIISFHKFPSLCDLLVSYKATMTKNSIMMKKHVLI